MRDFTSFRSDAALHDLTEIWFTLALDSRTAAMRVVEAIDRRILALADFPEMGPIREDVAPDLRMLVEGNYLILYRVRSEAVEIVRVVHGARDLASLF